MQIVSNSESPVFDWDDALREGNSIIDQLLPALGTNSKKALKMFQKAEEECERIVKEIPIEHQEKPLSQVHKMLMFSGARMLEGQDESILCPGNYNLDPNVLPYFEKAQNNGGAEILSCSEVRLIPEFRNTKKIASILGTKNRKVTGEIIYYVGVAEKAGYYREHASGRDVIVSGAFDSMVAYAAYKSNGRIYVTGNEQGKGGILLIENLTRNKIPFYKLK